ncbi:MAG TPA: hypothetical protein VGD99_25380 [Anaerolineae bacterium]
MGILLVTIITLSMTYVVLQAQQAPLWQIKLNNYIKYRNDVLDKDPLTSGTVTLENWTRASQSENFFKTRDKKLVVGDHYWLMENRDVSSLPPDEVICALLREQISKDSAEAEITYQVVFVANYLHTVEPDWVVFTGDRATVIGCDLEPGQ